MKCLIIDAVHSAIAEELGYCDQSFFSTSFKRRFGVYPLAWRELNG